MVRLYLQYVALHVVGPRGRRRERHIICPKLGRRRVLEALSFWEVVPSFDFSAQQGLGVSFASSPATTLPSRTCRQTRLGLWHTETMRCGEGSLSGAARFSLVVVDGPARYAGSFASSAKPCGASVCPFHCSGDDAIKGQQCVSRSMSVETMAKPATVRGGVPIADAVGRGRAPRRRGGLLQ